MFDAKMNTLMVCISEGITSGVPVEELEATLMVAIEGFREDFKNADGRVMMEKLVVHETEHYNLLASWLDDLIDAYRRRWFHIFYYPKSSEVAHDTAQRLRAVVSLHLFYLRLPHLINKD